MPGDRGPPPTAGLLVLLLFVVRGQERDGGPVLVLSTDAAQQDEAMDLTVDPGAPALLNGDLDVPVILDTMQATGPLT